MRRTVPVLLTKQNNMPRKAVKKVVDKVVKVVRPKVVAEAPVVTSMKKPRNAADWANRQK